MDTVVHLEPVDYLVIGHLSHDITPDGPRLGGTVSYSGLTAHAFGLRVGVVTAFEQGIALGSLDGISVVSSPSERTTTFENVPTADGRKQYVHHVASPILLDSVPDIWRRTPIIHIGPIVNEVEMRLDLGFSPALLGLTPQGWLRCWNSSGYVTPCSWPDAETALRHAGAAVISVEDVNGDEEQIEKMAFMSQILAVTEGPAGVRLYWNGDLRHFHAPEMDEVDATGAGDIFAAAFFIRLYTTRDPWEAARFATQISARSVIRPGLAGIPTPEEVQTCLVEVL